MKQTYTRADFSEQRGRDVMEFLVQLHVSHKLRERDAIKPLGKSTRLSPMIFDTGIGYEIQSQYLHQQADAVAHDAYVNGLYRAITPKEREDELAKATTPVMRTQKELELDQMQPNAGPWVNWLAKPPLIAQGVPWLEHNRVEGKPYLCYETQIMNPAKYRADFPLRLVALASIQDWDWVCWHYFGDGSLNSAGTDEKPFEKALDISTGSHPQGYHFTYDEVESAMIRAAGHMFTGKLVPAAPNPTRFTFGRDALFDPASMDYAGSYGRLGLDMIYTTYQHGVRVKIDPTIEKSSVLGPVVSIDDRATHNPYTPHGGVTFDWKKATLTIDTPASAAFTGLLARHGKRVDFVGGSGVTLSDVVLVNPKESADPVTDNERYIAFAFYSLDGKPLAESKRASMSIVSTSFNTGFHLSTGPDDPNKAGMLPVQVTRVGATVKCDAMNGMRYIMRDWNGAPIGSGVIQSSQIVIPSNLPVFAVEMSRD